MTLGAPALGDVSRFGSADLPGKLGDTPGGYAGDARRPCRSLGNAVRAVTQNVVLIAVAGRDVFSTMKAVIWDLHERGWASEHDALIASQIAWVLSGGDITEPAWVSEEYLLDLERKAFIRLCQEQKTIDRLGHMLEHNKPLRN